MDLLTWGTVCLKPISFSTELSVQVEVLHVRVELSDVLGEKWWLGWLWQATCWASLIRHRRLLSLLSTEALTSATTESQCHTSVFNGLWMGAAHSDVCVCDGSNFTCSIRQLFDATTDKMRYDEVTGDLTSSLSHTTHRHTEHFSLSRSADKVIFCCPSFFVVSFYLCVLKGRQLHSFLPLNTQTHTCTHCCCNDLTVSVCTLLWMFFIVLPLYNGDVSQWLIVQQPTNRLMSLTSFFLTLLFFLVLMFVAVVL